MGPRHATVVAAPRGYALGGPAPPGRARSSLDRTVWWGEIRRCRRDRGRSLGQASTGNAKNGAKVSSNGSVDGKGILNVLVLYGVNARCPRRVPIRHREGVLSGG